MSEKAFDAVGSVAEDWPDVTANPGELELTNGWAMLRRPKGRSGASCGRSTPGVMWIHVTLGP